MDHSLDKTEKEVKASVPGCAKAAAVPKCSEGGGGTSLCLAISTSRESQSALQQGPNVGTRTGSGPNPCPVGMSRTA